MEHVVIFAARPVSAAMLPLCADADYVIAADAGYQGAAALGIAPSLLLGDYDSAPPPENAQILPREKDDTDTYYAAKQALRLGARRVTILGGLGGRLSHTLANMQTLLFLETNGVHARLADETTQVRAFLPGEYTLAGEPEVYVSLLPAGERVTGITLSGFAYPLQNATLTHTFPLGVSNEFCEKTATLRFETGALYMILEKKQEPFPASARMLE